ncbi:NAD-dependent epimerase/dehydratase family protein [[Clostridium] polysaccharolyticum]|uniref:UDP-glucose 4-epimerase n=1 Tax=[Clostridium] polysaccharolyticum TaxID=29364 RepID=A0A1I0CQ73_9FIRM|nr:NAD(P)-dependent oxidoreductase [[Clostridium] polysaccharolyticum]SET21884.1 UDP-glucose 4-epimerase [[Clostridium] polysaccharolyticum]
MNVFITGGTGFIGSYVVDELVKRGHYVTLLARNTSKIEAFLQNDKIRILKGTLEEENVIMEGLKGMDACIHIALCMGETPTKMLEMDTRSAVYVFEKAAKLGVKHIIYTSSTAAIGQVRNHMDEFSHSVPTDLYGAAKAAAEAYLFAIANSNQIQCNILRPAYTFGNPLFSDAPMEPDSRFRDIVAAAKQGKPIELIKNDGTQFIWAKELAKLYLAVLESSENKKIYIAAGKEYITWSEVAKYAIELLHSKSVIKLKDLGWKKGACIYDSSAALRDFGIGFESREKVKEHIQFIANM